MATLVFGADAEVAEWVRARTPWVTSFGDCAAIGVANGARLVAGVVYSNYRGGSIEASIAADEPGWCRRGVLAGLFSYPWEQLRVRRITCIIPAENARSLRLCRGLGFKEEGRVRRAFDDGSDAILLGQLREECRWLAENIQDGMDSRKAA